MENLTQEQTETVLAKVSDLMKYLDDEHILFEFDNSLIDSLIRCYELLKMKTAEPDNNRANRIERYAEWYSESLERTLKD